MYTAAARITIVLGWLAGAVAVAAQSATPSPGVSDADRLRMQALGYEEWVKDDAPAKTGVVVHDRRRTAPGYVLFANRGSCNAKLIDNDGRVVHSWQGPVEGFWSDVELMPDGSLYVVGARDDEFANQLTARFLKKLNWDSSVAWQSSFPAHHDIEQAGKGRLLTLTSVERPSERFGPDHFIIDDHIVEMNDRHETIAEHSLYDLFNASPAAIQFGKYRRVEHRNGRKVVDLFHANAVQRVEPPKGERNNPLYRSGNILVCIRHQNLIAIFDPRKERVLWSWGRGTLEGPHSARLLPNGNIIVFDNGLVRRSSRILEIDPRRDQIVWRYQAKPLDAFFSPYGGSCQRLSNGNTFVAETHRGTLFEVNSKGATMWRYINPAEDPQKPRRATIHSAKRLERAYVEAILRRNAVTSQPERQ